ncbi:MAG: metallophosphoesterase [Planctomycetota bacterium]|nr:metallophosphoesterase [Planctomycetota bacterium]
MEKHHDVLLAVIGDVHASWRLLDRVLERALSAQADGILLVGDLGSHELAQVARRTPERDARYGASIEVLLDRLAGCRVPYAFVPGNHDLPDLAHERNADGRVLDVAGLRVAGIGGAGPQRFGFAYEWSEDEIRARTVPKCDVLLVHAPPARTALDLLASRAEHVGSEAIRERALAHDGVLVCGHIHESPGAVELGRCLCLNAGGLGAPYGRAQIGFVRRSGGIPGGWEVLHEDLQSGAVRSFRRTQRDGVLG